MIRDAAWTVSLFLQKVEIKHYVYIYIHIIFSPKSAKVFIQTLWLYVNPPVQCSAVLESSFLVEQKVINQVLLTFHSRRPDRLTLMFSLWKGSTDLRDFAVELIWMRMILVEIWVFHESYLFPKQEIANLILLYHINFVRIVQT